MNLIKNILAVVGVVTLALNAADDLQLIVALSKQISYVIDNWTELVQAIWREVCALLGIPHLNFLAKPFSFLVASLALAISAVISLAIERDVFLESFVKILREEASQSDPDARRAGRRIQTHLAQSTRLMIFDREARPILAHRGMLPQRRSMPPIVWVAGITGLYAATDMRYLLNEGQPWFVFLVMFSASLMSLYIFPFYVCSKLAAWLGRLAWSRENAALLKDELVIFKDESPKLAEQFGKFRINWNPAEAVFPADEGGLKGVQFLRAMDHLVPSAFYEGNVFSVMAGRAVASLLLLLSIYVLSYAIIIVERVA